MKKLILILTTLSSIVFAANEPPSGGTSIITKDAFVAPTVKMQGEEYGKKELISVEKMPFTNALRVAVTNKPVKYYAIQTKVGTNAPIKKGDVLLLSFYARTFNIGINGVGKDETGEGEISIGVQKKKSLELIGKFAARPGAEWQLYYVPMTSKADAEIDEAAVSISYGAMLQTIDIADVKLLNYGGSVKFDDLPKTEITYAGREADAPWRKAAVERIDKIRKADLNVTVKDASGKALPGATVDIKMTKHEFQWGSAITSRAGVGSPDREKILSSHKALFNQGLPITYFVWTIQETIEGKKGADDILKYFRDNQMTTRAHVLIWERMDHFPTDVQEMIKKGEKEKLRARITDYITKTVTTYKGRVDEWVVENEAVDNSEIRKILGEESIAEWFKVARQADPSAKFMINENRVEGLKPDKSDQLLKLCKTITDNGGDYDTIGIQGHFGAIPVPPEMLLKQYDKLAATGKKLAFTEYDHNSEDEKIKADYMRDMMTSVFSHPSFNCFTLWRFWDGKPEKRESVIYANDWTMRPSGEVYKDLVFNQWWTKASGKSDASGKFSTRGFLGEYEITVTDGAKTTVVKASLKKDQPNLVEVTLAN